MNRLVIAAVGLLAACTWSNSLYQARLLSKNALRAERDRQPGQAQLLWGQVIVKAESAYARAPHGARGAEALWLAGHAAARTHDCARAVPALQGALSAASHSPWQQQLLLELGACEEALGGPAAASIYAMLLAMTTDPAVRREGRLRQGHALLLQGNWDLALATLAGEDSLPARLDRATAFAQLGRTDRALAELSPALAASDSSVRWVDYIETFAVHNSAAADSLLDRVLGFPTLSVAGRSALILAAARAALAYDPAAADRRLRRLDLGSGGGAAGEGGMLQQQLRLTRPTTPSELRGPVDAIAAVDLADAGFAGRRLADLVRYGRQLLGKNDSTAAGAARGDLIMFALGELARDSLRAPRLGAWFFARLERDWPQSPYAAKALLARGPLEPDSADALLARVRRLPTNPYVAAANGDVAGRVQVPRLEDSLNRFIARLWVAKPLGTAVPERP